MIFALILLLVAAIVSAVMLNASVTSLKVVSSDRAYTQEQLSLDSCARLVSQELDGFSVRVSGPADAPRFALHGTDKQSVGLVKLALDSFAEAYRNPVGAYTSSNPYVSKPMTFAPGNDQLHQVRAVMSVCPQLDTDFDRSGSKSFDIAVVLTLQGESRAYSESVLLSQSVTSTADGTVYTWTSTIQGR
ncbi:MAG: hypothetical protein Q4D06_04540 [Coriobacteriia bacterium]|nr:hypothetical protein [Coriobacteriia bacterium]